MPFYLFCHVTVKLDFFLSKQMKCRCRCLCIGPRVSVSCLFLLTFPPVCSDLHCRHTEDMIVTPFAQVSPLNSVQRASGSYITLHAVKKKKARCSNKKKVTFTC